MNNPTKFSNRLGVDIGGTFTDIVLETNSKRFSAKVLTDNANPETAIFKGINDVCLKAHIAPSDLTQIIHGTTLATNSLIERKGAKTALITTEGFRDVIEMRTESRFEQYDLNLSLPEPLLSREHRYVLKERIDAQGKVLIPIEQRAVEDLANELRNKGYTSIAVGFLHSYVNNNHENVVGKIIHNKIPNIMVSLSNEVSPQVREYERFSTTVANAYIKPLIEKYLLNFSARKISYIIIGLTLLMFVTETLIANIFFNYPINFQNLSWLFFISIIVFFPSLFIFSKIDKL